MMGIQKVVAGSRNRKREKRMNATTQAKTRNVYVRDIMMPVVFCKDCKHKCIKGKTTRYHYCEIWKSAVDDTDFCSRGERKDD